MPRLGPAAPIFSAFAMEHVTSAERATLSATMTVLWQVGWVVGGSWYTILQAVLGFEGGYGVNFVTIITLYTIATRLYWVWFGRTDDRVRRRTRPAHEGPASRRPTRR